MKGNGKKLKNISKKKNTHFNNKEVTGIHEGLNEILYV
jgi:hypothetical protein